MQRQRLSEDVTGRVEAQGQLLAARRDDARLYQPTANEIDTFCGLTHGIEQLASLDIPSGTPGKLLAQLPPKQAGNMLQLA